MQVDWWGKSNPTCCNQIRLNLFALRDGGGAKTFSLYLLMFGKSYLLKVSLRVIYFLFLFKESRWSWPCNSDQNCTQNYQRVWGLEGEISKDCADPGL